MHDVGMAYSHIDPMRK